MPDCTISGIILDANGDPVEGVRVKILRLQQSGTIIENRTRPLDTSDEDGTVQFTLPQSSNATLKGNFFVGSTDFSGEDGVEVAIPASATADLEDLGDPVTLVPEGQPLDADLTAIAGLSPANDDFIQRKAGAWINRTPAQVLVDLGVAAAYQPLDADLTAIAALSPSNDDVVQRKAGAWVNRSIAQLTADLNLGAVYQPLDADLSAIGGLSPSNDDVIQRKAGAWVNRTVAQYKTDLGLATIATSGSASDLGAGTIPDARFPATLPALSGANLTALNASNLASGEVPDGRLSANVTLLGQSIDLSGAEATGILAAGRFPALTGDVTTSAGALAATIANDAVTFAKMQNIATARFLGRVTASSGDIEELTAGQMATALGLVIGTNVQAWDADLDTWATKTPPSGTVVGHSDAQTLTNKTLALGSNTVSGTIAQFNTALTDADFATLAGSESLSNKTLVNPLVTGMIDQEGALGAELVTNGTFTGSATGWTLGAGWAYGSNAVTHTPGDSEALSQAIAFIEGAVYVVEVTVSGMTAGVLTVQAGGEGEEIGEDGTYVSYLIAGDGDLEIIPDGDFDGTVDNVSVKRWLAGVEFGWSGGSGVGRIVPIVHEDADTVSLLLNGLLVSSAELEWSGPGLDSQPSFAVLDYAMEVAATRVGDGFSMNVHNLALPEEPERCSASLNLVIYGDVNNIGAASIQFEVHHDDALSASVNLGYDGDLMLWGLGLHSDGDLSNDALFTIDPATEETVFAALKAAHQINPTGKFPVYADGNGKLYVGDTAV